ncbi:hypothetical protein HJ590_08155 [Naumannella sp. ID2617S]|nr:hypothetical protein [Naumannella sp. ID2617S]
MSRGDAQAFFTMMGVVQLVLGVLLILIAVLTAKLSARLLGGLAGLLVALAGVASAALGDDGNGFLMEAGLMLGALVLIAVSVLAAPRAGGH